MGARLCLITPQCPGLHNLSALQLLRSKEQQQSEEDNKVFLKDYARAMEREDSKKWVRKQVCEKRLVLKCMLFARRFSSL